MSHTSLQIQKKNPETFYEKSGKTTKKIPEFFTEKTKKNSKPYDIIDFQLIATSFKNKGVDAIVVNGLKNYQNQPVETFSFCMIFFGPR